ncbi:MAG: SRPBCC family protein [Methylocystis sp.]|uniref:SRPBCC family protein n=1 Tax=Methylocystis sp. TaxID=1911079 RepID=UPI003DA540F9
MTFILLLVLSAVSALIAYVSLQPNTFRIARSAVIDAPAQRIYPLINDLHEWPRWSPWSRLHPQQTVTYDGSPLGAGAIMSWAGDKKVGAGKMKIAESSQNERIRIKIQFLKPMKAIHDVQFDLKPLSETRTEVVWTMSGRNEFLAKAIHAFMNMDRMVGGQFEEGLANLKALVETPAEA